MDIIDALEGLYQQNKPKKAGSPWDSFNNPGKWQQRIGVNNPGAKPGFYNMQFDDANGDIDTFLRSGVLNAPNEDVAWQLIQLYMQRENAKDAQAYESEGAKLARLMSLGMSRSAALGMLQNAGAATTPTTDAPDPSTMAAERAQQENAEMQTRLAGANVAASLLSSLAGLASTVVGGFSIPGILAQNVVAQATAQNMQLASAGMNMAGSFAGALATSVNAADGMNLQPDEQTYQSWQSMKDWTLNQQKLKDSGQPYNAAVLDWQNSPDVQQNLDNPYMWQQLRAMYMENTAARGFKDLESQSAIYSDMLLGQRDMQQIQKRIMEIDEGLKELDFVKLSETLQAQIQTILNDATLSNFEVETLPQQKELLNLEITGQRLSNVGQETANKMAAEELQQYLNEGELRKTLTAYNLLQYEDQLEFLQAARTPEQLKLRRDALMNNQRFKTITSLAQLYAAQYGNVMMENNPLWAHLGGYAYVTNQFGINPLGDAVNAGVRIGDLYQKANKPQFTPQQPPRTRLPRRFTQKGG